MSTDTDTKPITEEQQEEPQNINHYATIESAPDLDWDYELKEWVNGNKVGVIGGFDTKDEAREYYENNLQDELPLKDDG